MDKNEYSCVLDLPYPCVKGKDNNRLVIELLYKAYLGELYAISGYTYQEMLFESDYEIAAETIECIAITEMKHFKMLGKLILKLGYDPKIKFTDSSHKSIKAWRNPSVNDMFYKKTIYDDIAEEKSSAAAYRKILGITADKDIKELINRIILDEEHHVETLERLIK